MNSDAYEAPALTVLGDVEELTAGGQGTGDGTGSLKPDAASEQFGIAG
jgi:hypothetical protein